MICALFGVTLAGLDAAIANIALPLIARDLHSTEAGSVWVVSAYQLVLTVCLLPAAAVGEARGLRGIYGIGLALFTAASFGCALATSMPLLVAARVFQAIGGACMAALSGALVRAVTPRAELHKAFAAIALAVAFSSAIGPTLASALLAVATWPWLFLINVPIGIVVTVLFLRVAPREAGHGAAFDSMGAVLNAGALGLMVLGVDTLGQHRHWLAAAELIGAGLCALALVRQQRHQARPMLPLDLLGLPLFSLSIVTSSCAYAAQILAYVALPFLIQNGMHRSPVETGLLVTPWPLLVACAAPLAGRLATRYPAALLSSIGLTIMACGLVGLASMPHQPGLWGLLARMALCGIGFGFYQTPNNLTVMTTGPAQRSGAASGMLAVARTTGWSLGSALVALIFGLTAASAGSGAGVGHQADTGPRICLWAGAAFALIGVGFSLSRALVRRPVRAG